MGALRTSFTKGNLTLLSEMRYSIPGMSPWIGSPVLSQLYDIIPIRLSDSINNLLETELLRSAIRLVSGVVADHHVDD